MINNNPIIKVGCGEGTVAMGVVGNFNARQQTFDISLWTQQLGEGTLIVSLLRPDDAAPYAVADVVVDGSTATWTFDNTDTAVGGWGKVFLTYRGADFEDPTTDYDVYIATNSAPDGEVPSGLESWYQRMLEAAANAQIAATNAAASAEAAAESESTVEAYKDAAETAARNAAAAQALADQYAAAAANAQSAAEAARDRAETAQTDAEAAQASAIAAAQAAAADKLAADASAAAAQAAKESALAAQVAAAASAAAAAESEQSVADNAAAAIAARDAAQRAQEAAQASQTAAASSAQAASNSAAAAQTAASDAVQSAQAAAASATSASGSATAAESWAVGGTDTREGEDTDNAKYYATQAGDANDDVQAARTDIQDSIDGVAQEDTAQQTLALLQAISAQLQTIIDQGGSAGDLNGFSLSLGEDSTVVISYTDPDDETITGSATFPTNDTSAALLAQITSIKQSLAIIAGQSQEDETA